MLARRTLLQRIQWILAGLTVAALLGILAVLGENGVFARISAPRLALPVALISGHAGNDSGAVCTDEAGNVLITEAEINARVAGEVERTLTRRGIPVIVLDEFDHRLDGLRATLLLSLHADSCIARSGFKAAKPLASRVPDAEVRLVRCIDEHYAALTGLEPDPDTVTPNMTEYHAYRKIDPATPAAILELGFLGADQALISQRSDLIAAAVVESILCFVESSEPQ